MKKISILALALGLSFATFAQTWSADKAHTKVQFTVTHLGLSEVDGVFKDFDAKVTSSKEDFSDAVFEFSAAIKSVSTLEPGCFRGLARRLDGQCRVTLNPPAIPAQKLPSGNDH